MKNVFLTNCRRIQSRWFRFRRQESFIIRILHSSIMSIAQIRQSQFPLRGVNVIRFGEKIGRLMKRFQFNNITNWQIFAFGYLYSSFGGFIPKPLAENAISQSELDLKDGEEKSVVVFHEDNEIIQVKSTTFGISCSLKIMSRPTK
jgi:hypothetical protein